MQALGIVLFALIILVSVCLHEAGHMVTAKSFGMKVTRYFAGFGPTLWSFRKGETEYGVKAIPLGGFVKIVGMTPQDDDVEPGDEDRAMWRFPVWKRTIVMAAGSVTHFIIGFVLLWIAFSFVGMPNPAAAKIASNPIKAPAYVHINGCASTSATQNSCAGDPQKSPAQQAGLKNGDKIIAVDGQPVSTYGDLINKVRSTQPGAKVAIIYQRGGQTYTIPSLKLATVMRAPLSDPNGKPVKASALGVSNSLPPGMPANVKYGVIDSVGHAGSFYGSMFGEIGTALKSLPGKIPGLWDALNGKQRDPNGPVSIVGASELGGQSAKLGLWNLFIVIAASLNIFVGVFNLLPLLPLDGGHIAIAWYEKLRSWFAHKRRKPEPGRVDYYKLMPLTYAVILIFGGFSLLTILADIVNPINISQ